MKLWRTSWLFMARFPGRCGRYRPSSVRGIGRWPVERLEVELRRRSRLGEGVEDSTAAEALAVEVAGQLRGGIGCVGAIRPAPARRQLASARGLLLVAGAGERGVNGRAAGAAAHQLRLQPRLAPAAPRLPLRTESLRRARVVEVARGGDTVERRLHLVGREATLQELAP